MVNIKLRVHDMMQAGAYVASVVSVEQGHTQIQHGFICALRCIVN